MSGQGIVERLVRAFEAGDLQGMRDLLDVDLVAYVTNAQGGEDRVDGRDAYLERLRAMDLPAARFTVELTQRPVEVRPNEILAMVQIRAERGGRRLHNYAAHLVRLSGGRVSEWRMVDAKPAESDAFWSS